MMEINYAGLGNKITKYRKLLDLKAPELANKCNLSAGFINLIERGAGVGPTLDNLQKIADVLETDIDSLLMDSLSVYNNIEIESVVDQNLLNSFYSLSSAKRECALDMLRYYLSLKEATERPVKQESIHMLELKEKMESSTYIQEMIAELASLNESQQQTILDIIKAATNNMSKGNL